MTPLTAWAAASLVAATAACASTQARQVRERQLTAQLDALRYPQLDAAWQEARRLLAERGYPLAGEDARAVGQDPSLLSRIFSPARETRDDHGLRVLQTGRVRDGMRYRLEGSSLPGEAGCRIVFTAIKQDPTEHRDAEPYRDLALELALAHRLDPEAAARIEAGLEQHRAASP